MTETLAQIGRYGFTHMDGWGWVPAVIGLAFMVLVVGLVAWLIWSLARRGEVARPERKPALAVLDERYAKGEIDRDEYLQRKSDLGG